MSGKDSTPAWEPPGVDDAFSGGPSDRGKEPLPEPEESTPFEADEPEGTIPACPLWAMKDRRHVQWSEIAGFPPRRIREAFGQGDKTVYVMDDGHQHVMFGRKVGDVADGSQYGLVGRAPKSAYEAILSGERPPSDAFSEADEVALCGVDVDKEDKASDVFVVQFYGTASAVPPEYLPGSPLISLSEPLPIADL